MRTDNIQIRLFRKYLKYLLPYRRKVILILFLGVSSVLLGLVIPYLSKLVVDTAEVMFDDSENIFKRRERKKRNEDISAGIAGS